MTTLSIGLLFSANLPSGKPEGRSINSVTFAGNTFCFLQRHFEESLFLAREGCRCYGFQLHPLLSDSGCRKLNENDQINSGANVSLPSSNSHNKFCVAGCLRKQRQSAQTSGKRAITTKPLVIIRQKRVSI